MNRRPSVHRSPLSKASFLGTVAAVALMTMLAIPPVNAQPGVLGGFMVDVDPDHHDYSVDTMAPGEQRTFEHRIRITCYGSLTIGETVFELNSWTDSHLLDVDVSPSKIVIEPGPTECLDPVNPHESEHLVTVTARMAEDAPAHHRSEYTVEIREPNGFPHTTHRFVQAGFNGTFTLQGPARTIIISDTLQADVPFVATNHANGEIRLTFHADPSAPADDISRIVATPEHVIVSSPTEDIAKATLQWTAGVALPDDMAGTHELHWIAVATSAHDPTGEIGRVPVTVRIHVDAGPLHIGEAPGATLPISLLSLIGAAGALRRRT